MADLHPEPDPTDASPDEGTPRWVYAFGGVFALLALLVVVLHLTGQMGGHLP